jgi:predicted DNA binding protein
MLKSQLKSGRGLYNYTYVGDGIIETVKQVVETVKENPTIIPSVISAGKETFNAVTAVKEIKDKQNELNELRNIKNKIKQRNKEKVDNTKSLTPEQQQEIAQIGKGFVKF